MQAVCLLLYAADIHYRNVCNPYDLGALTQPRLLLWGLPDI